MLLYKYRLNDQMTPADKKKKKKKTIKKKLTIKNKTQKTKTKLN